MGHYTDYDRNEEKDPVWEIDDRHAQQNEEEEETKTTNYDQ